MLADIEIAQSMQKEKAAEGKPVSERVVSHQLYSTLNKYAGHFVFLKKANIRSVEY